MFDTTEWDSPEIDDLQEQDGAVGSGVFDPGGGTTVHPDMGVFADHPALPQYIADHAPFRPFEDERGIEMEVPTGGSAYIDIPNQPSIPLVPAKRRTPVRTSGDSSDIPFRTMERAITQSPITDPIVVSRPIGGAGTWVGPPVIVRRPITRQPAPSRALSGVEGAPSWPQYAFAGVLLGVAIGVFHNTMQTRR